jgi:hypothetical protein
MEIRKKFVLIISILFIILSFSLSSYAGWTGPTTIVAGTWGTGTTQFGLEHGDTSDTYPELDGILGDGSIVISDLVDKRTVVYNSNGSFKDEDTYTEQRTSDGMIRYFHKKYLLGCCPQGYSSSGNLWTGSDNIYALFDNTGTLLTTTSSRPMELGILSQKITGTSHYKRIEYPDGVYFYYYTGSTDYFSYASGIFRVNTNLIMDVHNSMQPSRVYAFTATVIPTPAGQKQQYQLLLNATWKAPLPQYKPVYKPPDWPPNAEPPRQGVAAEYGEAVIGPDGSIYTWVRSDTDYKIVKWTWSP